MVISAPTGSGKTTIFELSIIHLLKKQYQDNDFNLREPGRVKIIYLAPLKVSFFFFLKFNFQSLERFS